MASLHRPAERDPWFDNAKFALVTLVVVGHSLTLLPANTTDAWLYQFLYSWHVPAFVLITGYLSRSFDFTAERMWSLARTVLVPYLVFEGLLALFRTYLLGEHLVRVWLNPHWPMWYLVALLFWRLATPLLKRMPAPVAIASAVAISLAGGLWGGATLDHSRILGLLPFFVVGLTLRKEQIAVLKRRWAAWAGLGVLLAIFVAARFSNLWLSAEWLYYRTPYAELGVSPATGMVTRSVVLAVGLAGSLAVLALVPRKHTWFTSRGAASLVVYLFHGFVVKTAIFAGAPAWAAGNPTIALLALPALAVALSAALATPGVARRLNAFVDPVGWLNRRLPTPDPSKIDRARPVPSPMTAGLR